MSGESGSSASAPKNKSRVRNKGVTNVNRRLLTEFQALIAFASYDSPSISQGGESMTEASIEKIMSRLCFGDEDDNETTDQQKNTHNETDLVCYVDQFLLGLNKFKGLYTVDIVQQQQQGTSGGTTASGNANGGDATLVMTMLPILHRQGSNVSIVVGEGSIEKSFLSRKSLLIKDSAARISGRTLLRHAKEVLANCKKMQALVTSSRSPYKDKTFPSGTNWDDYIHWCLGAMYRLEEERGGDLPNGAGIVDNAIQQQQEIPDHPPPAPGEEDIPLVASVEGETEIATSDFPENYYFKGFLAWCLWGFIPIDEATGGGAARRSLLFTDSKTSTSFGRKTGSRTAMRKASREAEEELLGSIHTGDNRPGQKKKQRASNNHTSGIRATTVATGVAEDNHHHEQHATAMTNVLSRTLAFMDSESREKQIQRQVALQIRIVRDEIAFVTRKADKLAERYYNLKERSNPGMLDQLDVYDVEIANLESKLKDLQNSEVARRARAIESRLSLPHQDASDTFTASTSVASVSGVIMPLGGIFETPPQRTTSPLTTISNKPTQEEQQQEHILQTTTSYCIECQVIPTTHKCHRCKGLVCDLCCSTKRGLEMIWWCGNCFESESLTTQNLIRSGMYYSDDDDDG